MDWMTGTFGVTKPVIGMCHLKALPGDPGYDAAGGMSAVVDDAAREVRSLQKGGIDGILISNEFSLPYLTKAEPVTGAAMAYVIGCLREQIQVPFGVDILWDGLASIDLAVATGASFVREIFSGVYASDFGLWNTNIGQVARHRHNVGADHVKLIFNVVPEAAVYLAERDLAALTRSTVFNAIPDALCVSGLTAGTVVDGSQLKMVKDSAGDTPVIVNTGVTDDSAADLLTVADGAIVGTFFKREGEFYNPVETGRVERLMTQVKKFREQNGA